MNSFYQRNVSTELYPEDWAASSTYFPILLLHEEDVEPYNTGSLRSWITLWQAATSQEHPRLSE